MKLSNYRATQILLGLAASSLFMAALWIAFDLSPQVLHRLYQLFYVCLLLSLPFLAYAFSRDQKVD